MSSWILNQLCELSGLNTAQIVKKDEHSWDSNSRRNVKEDYAP